jgi:hypothetical protein
MQLNDSIVDSIIAFPQVYYILHCTQLSSCLELECAQEQEGFRVFNEVICVCIATYFAMCIR